MAGPVAMPEAVPREVLATLAMQELSLGRSPQRIEVALS